MRYTRKRKGEESRSNHRKERKEIKETRRSKDMGCAGCRKVGVSVDWGVFKGERGSGRRRRKKGLTIERGAPKRK